MKKNKLSYLLYCTLTLVLMYSAAFSKQEFDYDFPDFTLYSSVDLILQTEQLRIEVIDILNETDENIYVFMDNFVFYNDLMQSETPNDVNPLTSQIILYKEGANLSKYENIKIKNNYSEYPAYYKRMSGVNLSFTIYNSIKSLKGLIDLNSKYLLKMNMYYFKESDKEKIEKTLGQKIDCAKLQIDNSNVIYGFRTTASETLLNCANSNITNINPEKLKIVIEKYIHKIEGIGVSPFRLTKI